MPFVQTLRCSCEKIKGQVDKWRYRCELPLNKDTERGRGREREATAAVELLLVHITHTKSICAEVAPVAFWVVSASTKFSTTRCSCPYHRPAGRINGCPRRGTVGVGHASRRCVYCVAVQSVYVLLL